MPFLKKHFKNILFFVAIAMILIPQTRRPIQVALHKVIALVKPVQIHEAKLKKIPHYQWKLVDEQGVVYNFENAKNKVVLINFWATWCPPCIAEMPSLQALYNDYKDKVVFLFVTTDWYSDINPFLKKHQYTFKVFRPADAYPEYFDIPTIPRTFLINADGEVIIDEDNAANWNSKKIRQTIDNLLK